MYARAGALLDCHVGNVPKLIGRGLLTSHGGRGTKGGSLDRVEVEALAERRRAEAEARARRVTPVTPRRPLPPDTEHDWITAPAAAEILGVTPRAVTARLRRDRLPGVRHGGQWWMQRQHVLLEAKRKLRL